VKDAEETKSPLKMTTSDLKPTTEKKPLPVPVPKTKPSKPKATPDPKKE